MATLGDDRLFCVPLLAHHKSQANIRHLRTLLQKSNLFVAPAYKRRLRLPLRRQTISETSPIVMVMAESTSTPTTPNDGEHSPAADNIIALAPVAARASRQTAAPRRTDHTYHDWAQHSPDDYQVRSVSKKSTNNFVSACCCAAKWLFSRELAASNSPNSHPRSSLCRLSLPSCTRSCPTPSMLMPFAGSLMDVVSA